VSLNTTETNDPNASVTKIPQQKMTVNVSAKIHSDTTHFCNIKPHAYAVVHLGFCHKRGAIENTFQKKIGFSTAVLKIKSNLGNSL